MRHVLFHDVDGTLLPAGDTLPPSETIAAVDRFYANDGKLIPVTSNSEVLLRPVAQALGLRDHGVLDGGATIYDYACGRRDEQLSRWLEAEKAKRIVAALKPFVDEIYYDEHSTKRTRETVNLDEVTYTPSIFAIYSGVHDARIAHVLGDMKGISAHPNRYEETNDTRCVQVVQHGVNKQSGVGLLLNSDVYQDYLGSDMAAAGDGENDEHLMQALRPGALTIAMGNAVPRLKAMAQVQVADVRAGGFAEIINVHMLGGR